MSNKFKVKRGTNLSNITTAPEAGELIYKTDTNELYVGDGSTAATGLTSIGGTGTVDTSGTPIASEYARFTDSNTIQGISAAGVRTDLGLVIGTNVQAQNDYLQDIADLNPTVTEDGKVLSWNEGNEEYELVDQSGGVSFNGSTANGLLTYGNSTTADVESNLTFDGSTLKVTGDTLIGRTSAFSSARVEIQNDATEQLTLNNVSTDGKMLSLYNSGSIVGGLGNDVTELVIYQGTTEAMRIDASQNVGIGTNSPLSKLHIEESTNDADALMIRQTAGGSGSVQGKVHIGMNHFNSTNPSVRITAEELDVADYRGNLAFSTRAGTSDVAPTEKMRITHDGNVGIGTTSPAYKLDVSGTGRFSEDIIANGLEVGTAYSSDNQYLGIKRSAASGNDYMIIQGSGSDVGSTYISAGSGKNVSIRANANSTTNQLVVSTSGSTIGGNTVWHAGNTSSFTGDIVSSQRDKGLFGTYDSYKTDHIWSMGTTYRNSSTGADFGNLYGLAYKHVNNTTGGNMAGGHQMVWVTNGTPRAALGETSIWSKNYFHAARNYGSSWDNNRDTALTFTASSSGTAYNVLRCDTDNGFKLQTLGGTGGTQRWYTSDSNYIQFTGTTISASLSGTASNAALLDNIDSSEFLRSNVADTIGAQLTMGTQTSLVASNYGHGVFGVYHATKYQHVWSMGTAYKGPADGASTGNIGNLYGLAWSYNPDYGAPGNNAQSKTGLAHQLLLANNGVTFTALGNGMWTKGHITIGTNDYALYGIDTSNQVRNLIKINSGNSILLGDANLTGQVQMYPQTYAEILTNYGYLQIGPQNGSHCHYTTDRANHWFNKMIYVNGGVFASYNADLVLKRLGGSADRIEINDTYQRFITQNAERFRIDTGGVDVTGAITATSTITTQYGVAFTNGNTNFLFYNNTGDNVFYLRDTTNNQMLQTWGTTSSTIHKPLTVQGNISSTADVIAYSTSDKRLKDNLKPIENSLDKVSKLSGYEFNWNDKQDTYQGKDVGVVAQEVEEVLPEVVTTRDNGYKAVKYEKIVPLLIEAIKEQQQQINKLEEKLNG